MPVALNFSSASDRHLLDRQTRDRFVVGDDDHALGHIGGRTVEGRDRHVGFLRERDQHRLGVAVVGGQDDAVGALRDAVLDLLELAIGVLAAVQLDHLDVVLLQRRDDRLVARAPEAGREILERVADLLAGASAGAAVRRAPAPASARAAQDQLANFIIRAPSRSCGAADADAAFEFSTARPTRDWQRSEPENLFLHPRPSSCLCRSAQKI